VFNIHKYTLLVHSYKHNDADLNVGYIQSLIEMLVKKIDQGLMTVLSGKLYNECATEHSSNILLLHIRCGNGFSEL